MTDSILNSIKDMIGGLDPEDDSYDIPIIAHINSAFSVLTDRGVGPEEGFLITGPDEVWSDYIQTSKKMEMVKTYIYLNVKLTFDPPSNATYFSSLEKMMNQYEWRLANMKDIANST